STFSRKKNPLPPSFMFNCTVHRKSLCYCYASHISVLATGVMWFSMTDGVTRFS
ncbi:hypothetical protein L9F63_015051, partial [Diploptera punctata]